MRVLVTGITGFAGPVVAAALLEAGHEVHGLVRGAGPWPRLGALPLAPDAFHRGDLADGRFPDLVRALAPGALVHLAGLSFAPAAERDPASAYRTNLGGTLAVLAAARAHAPRARLLVVTSSDVYGEVRAEDLPIVEETPLRPVSVYGASKAAADIAAAQWARAYGLDVVRARPFNHAGPGTSIAEVIAVLRGHARVPVRVQSDPALRRAVDVPRVVGSHARIAADTGWRPRIALADTLATVLDDWRRRLAS